MAGALIAAVRKNRGSAPLAYHADKRAAEPEIMRDIGMRRQQDLQAWRLERFALRTRLLHIKPLKKACHRMPYR